MLGLAALGSNNFLQPRQILMHAKKMHDPCIFQQISKNFVALFKTFGVPRDDKFIFVRLFFLAFFFLEQSDICKKGFQKNKRMV